MIYRLVNGEAVIAQVISDFNIDNSDWIIKSPKWILDCMEDIRVVSHLEPQTINKEIVNNKVELPCHIKNLKAVIYNDAQIDREDIIDNESDTLTYRLLGNNYIELNTNIYFPNGDKVEIIYQSLPVVKSTLYNVFMPMIPDNFDVINAAANYVLIKYLQQGYSHAVYSLNNNNIYTNPALAYYGPDNKSGLRMVARNSINSLDADTMYNIQNRLHSLNSNYVNTRKFKTKGNVQ